MRVDGLLGKEIIMIPTPLKVDVCPKPNVHLMLRMKSFMKCDRLVPTTQLAPPSIRKSSSLISWG